MKTQKYMNVYECLKYTTLYRSKMENEESNIKQIEEWRDAASDMNDYTEYRKAVVKLLTLEKSYLITRQWVAMLWFNEITEMRLKLIEKRLKELGVNE